VQCNTIAKTTNPKSICTFPFLLIAYPFKKVFISKPTKQNP